MIYNFFLLLGSIFILPKWLLQKKYKGSIKQRLGLTLPKESSGKVNIWIHMVSMGETRAMIPIYAGLKKKYPDAAFHFSSTTKTGHEEAKRSLLNGDNYFYLPLDFSWTMKRLCKLLKPDLLFLSESDFWFQMIQSVKKRGGKVIVLNAKISEKSTSRFSKVPSSKLFSNIDYFCVQNQTYSSRFKSLNIPNEKMSITGNLKLSTQVPKLSSEERQNDLSKFNLLESDMIITIGSTHEYEEELIIPHIPQKYKILLAPRHPERLASIKARYRSNSQITVIDQMGILTRCFQLSNLAIIGGSFIPGIGGHNIFEPIQAHIPVIFGPFMKNQEELVDMVLRDSAGIQTSAETLGHAIEKALKLTANAEKLAERGSEVLKETFRVLELNKLLD